MVQEHGSSRCGRMRGFTTALNTSTAFAEEAAQLPVIGTLARVLTFRNYEAEKNGIGIAVEVPTIDMIQTETGIQVDEVNQQIYDLCRQYAEKRFLIQAGRKKSGKPTKYRLT